MKYYGIVSVTKKNVLWQRPTIIQQTMGHVIIYQFEPVICHYTCKTVLQSNNTITMLAHTHNIDWNYERETVLKVVKQSVAPEIIGIELVFCLALLSRLYYSKEKDLVITMVGVCVSCVSGCPCGQCVYPTVYGLSCEQII